jgi:hypothetical protein
MKIRTMALAMGGAFLLALGGVGAVACSSDDGTGTPATGTDASVAKDTGTTKADTGTVDQPDTSTPDTDAGVGAPDCGRAPPTFHPVDAGTGAYCPFSSVGADAGNVTCAQGQFCCEHQADAGTPSSCQAAGAGGAVSCGATDTYWQCQDPNSCGTGQVCCAVAASAGQDPGCSFYFLSKFKGTACRAACATGELTVCESDGQCPTGQTCQNVTAKGGSFGFCK